MRTEARAWIAQGAALVAAMVLGGCPGTLADKERYLVDGRFVSGDLAPAPFDATAGEDAALDGGGDGPKDPCGDVPTRLLQPSCGGTGCHGATGPQAGLDLASPGLAARVVGKQALGCSVLLADPKNPTASLLYTKLLPQPPCGSQMPLARDPLAAFDVACVRDWIAKQ